MSELLLPTKIFRPPRRPSLIPRPRLIQKLNAGLGQGEHGFTGKVSLVSAPPGFGKTTLVAEWLDQLSQTYQVAWLSLEARDDDPARFIAYLVGALQTVQPDLGQALRGALSPPPELALQMLVHELAALSSPIILVLDDFHVIVDPAINQAVAFFFDHVPPNMHLVIIGRADPPFSLSRLRIRRQLSEIRAHDLRFSLEEAAAFLQHTMGLQLTVEDVALLERRTEGWVAGLQLAAHSLQLGEDKEEFLSAFAGDDRYIADYLVEEVLALQPETIQAFLLQTSILDRLNGRLCDALLERQDSQATLERLEQANLFIVPLDNRRQWYRYHHLFAQLLRERVEVSGQSLAKLHRRASRWYAENGLMPQAVEHALSAADYDRAAELMLLGSPEMFAGSQLTTLLRWWQQIPDELSQLNLPMTMMIAWAWLATGYAQEAEACLQMVEQALGRSASDLAAEIESLEPAVRNSLIEVTAIRLSIQATSVVDAAQTLSICQRILPYLTGFEPPYLFSPLISLRPVALYNMGQAYQSLGQLDQALSALEEAINQAKQMGNVHIVASALAHVAEVQMLQGRLNEAAATCQQGIEVVGELAGEISPLTGLLHVRLGQLRYEWNELEEAVRQLEEGIRVAKPWLNREALLPGYLALVRAHWALGQEAQAEVAAGELQALIESDLRLVESQEAIQFAWLQALRGQRTPRVPGPESRVDILEAPPQREVEAILQVQLWLAANNLDEAGKWSQRLLDSAESGARWRSVVVLLLLQALIREAQGQRPAALNALGRALELAEPAGYVRTFVDHGLPLAQLLSEVAVGAAAGSYAARLLAVLADDNSSPNDHPAVISSASTSVTPTRLLEPLSERELEVLQLIAEGLSNREIAARLYITLGTVKVHAHNLYGKLDVSGRTQAVAKARQLNLLP